MTGEKDESDIRTLPRTTFHRGGIDSFVMTSRRSLGALQYLRIWHDNTGVGDYASWFLGAVIVRDLQTGEKYQFANDRWLAVEYGDGEVGGAKSEYLIKLGLGPASRNRNVTHSLS